MARYFGNLIAPNFFLLFAQLFFRGAATDFLLVPMVKYVQMITTNFLSPTTVTQSTHGQELSWVLPGSRWTAGFTAMTMEPLRAVDNLSALAETRITGLLIFSGWDTSAVTGTLLGIEARVLCRKSSRVRDSQIQLLSSGQTVGNNRANAGISYYNINTADFGPTQGNATGDDSIYGGTADLWNASLAVSDLSNLSIGVRYQSGSMPHQDFAYCSAVMLRINYLP